MSRPYGNVPFEANPERLDAEMFELTILMPASEASEIEAHARNEGLTLARFVRRLLIERIASDIRRARSSDPNSMGRRMRS